MVGVCLATSQPFEIGNSDPGTCDTFALSMDVIKGHIQGGYKPMIMVGGHSSSPSLIRAPTSDTACLD